ncbi:hypothetical protein [Singulisphaera sp. PoT]|uniref:hypothetical protein n=1 Tax=Singulisphaera sp. PoT TaxID=3411797 RepID=UPI003BF52181
MARIDGYIAEPSIILLGCRAWDNSPYKNCPVCHGCVGDDGGRVYCARCDAMSPAIESKCRSSRIASEVRKRSEAAARDYAAALAKKQRGSARLTEIERRQIANGYTREGIGSRDADVVNRAAVGRDWLRSIGQEPDYDLILDKRGNVIGRHSEPQQAQGA